MKNNTFSLSKVALATLFLAGTTTVAHAAENVAKAVVDFNLRYENVDQDNDLRRASGLTLRSSFTFETKTVNNFSALVEFEDVRTVLGVDGFNDTQGNNAGLRSVIADPETTEVDQAYIQYKKDNFTAKVGRQVINLDGVRFVGNVGWRQDHQTFDAATFVYAKDKLRAQYSYLTKRNRIFAEGGDFDSDDHLLNVSYQTSVGKVVGYSYLLDQDGGPEINTYGLSFVGKKDNFIYAAEFAAQDNDDIDTIYYKLEGGYNFGAVTAKLGYEVLGSDDGEGAFSTPLATLHKFNGWNDQFLNTPAVGLVDAYATLTGKAFGGKWNVTYHDFTADDDSATLDDLGSEIDASYVRKIAKNYRAGIKLALYDADDFSVDSDKVWFWVGAKF